MDLNITLKTKRTSQTHALLTGSAAALCALTSLPSCLDAAPPLYIVKDLGVLPSASNSGSYPYGVSPSGKVTGFSSTVTGGTTTVDHAFLHNGTSMVDLGTLPGGTFSYGTEINASGWVTGYSTTTVPGPSTHAFLYNGTSMIDLGTLGGVASEGYGINASGHVTGYSTNVGGVSRAFFYNGTSMTDIGTLGGSASRGYAINDNGVVAGEAGLPGDASAHAFVTTGAGLTDLGTLGGPNSAAYGINTAGQVTGYAKTVGGAEHAFKFTPGLPMLDLGTLGGTHSYGAGINASGDVAGYSKLPGDLVAHGFLHTAGTMYDLNDLVVPGSGFGDISVSVLGNPINDSGQIVASGLHTASGQYRSILLTRATALEKWRLTYYNTTANAGAAANLADPYATGTPNLVAFSFGLNPAQSTPGAIPRPLITGGAYVLSFAQPPGVSGITYGAEWSTTLQPGSWTPIGNTGTPPQYIFSVPIGTKNRLFLRSVIKEP